MSVWAPDTDLGRLLECSDRRLVVGGRKARIAMLHGEGGEPRRLASPIQSAAEVAEEDSAILVVSPEELDVATFERALDGLVRQAHHDREALISALKPMSALKRAAGRTAVPPGARRPDQA